MQMYNGSSNVLGLMSGTSLDGMDAALVRFSEGDDVPWELLEYRHFQYPKELLELVNKAFTSPELLRDVDIAFAEWTIQCIKITAQGSVHPIDLVGTHGQTIFHQPERKWTYQAGCMPYISTKTGIPVVTNFRIQDVLLGGQGAPLVPFGDMVLFGEYEAALNIGGFVNVSLGKPLLKEGVSAAFDICPANIVLNQFARELNADFDNNGEWAREGSINQWVLDELDSLAYYELTGPKSLGAEWVESEFIQHLDILSPKDALATCVEHMVHQIDRILHKKQVFVTGGGALNKYLIQRLEYAGVECVLPDKTMVDAKEAIIFALLAYKRIRGENNVLGHTTGSRIDHSSGCIFNP